MKRIINSVRHFFTRRTFYATISIHGVTVKVPIDAPDFNRAKIEAEEMLDDIGVLLDLVEE